MSGPDDLFLGVDGGGTKTAFCLLDGSGRVVATSRTDSIYYLANPDGIYSVQPLLDSGISEVCSNAGISRSDVRQAFFGMPSYGEVSGDVPTLNAIAARALGHDRFSCDCDMVCGWAGSLGATDGINVIAGTGSMTYGEYKEAKSRVGGWGELFGDEGSGYWVAIQGLNLFSRMADGRAKPGPLLEILRERLSLATDLDLIDVVLNRWAGNRGKIAATSRDVADAAVLGDVECQAILDAAALQLSHLVDATRVALKVPPGVRLPISWSGGMFSNERILDGFRRALATHDNYEVRTPLLPPDIGAALYAAKTSGLTTDETAELVETTVDNTQEGQRS